MVREPKEGQAEGTLLRNSWLALAMLTMIQLTGACGSFSLGPLAPFLKDGLGLSRAQVGMFTSATYLGYIVLAIPWGRLADSIGPRKVLLFSSLLQGIAYLGFSRAPSFLPAFMAVFISGTGYGAITAATVKGLVNWFPARMRATTIGIKQTGAPVGGALCALVLPTLAVAFTWRTAATAVGFTIIASAAICFLLYRDSPGRELPPTSTTRHEGALLRILKNRDIILVGLVSIAYGMLEFSMTTYLVLYIKESLLLTAVAAGTFLAVAQVCGGSGRILWGVVSDRLMGGRRRGILIILGLIGAVMLMFLSFWASRMPVWLTYVTVAVFGATGMGWFGVQLTLASELAGTGLAATGTALVMTITSVGSLLGPPIFGYLVDLNQSYTLPLRLLGGVVIIAALMLLFVRERKQA